MWCVCVCVKKGKKVAYLLTAYTGLASSLDILTVNHNYTIVSAISICKHDCMIYPFARRSDHASVYYGFKVKDNIC